MIRTAAVTALALAQVGLTAALKCSDIKADLPCAEIPRCDSGTVGHIEINQLSNGLGSSSSTSEISMCFDDINLHVNQTMMGQQFLTNPGYTACDDPIFNADVAELFIAPNMEETPHCYNELDISPFNVMFDAGIYNEDLSYHTVDGYEFDCKGTGIDYASSTNMNENMWEAQLTFTFELLNCPHDCPLARYCGHSTANDVYRANFFRINELVATSSCSSSTCEYMAWSPTMINPPAFHEPSKFGYLLLQF
jgi:hypothetical protein